MNQEAIGKFISTCRKDKGLTQAQKNLLRITINEQIHNMHKIQTLRSCVGDNPSDLEHLDE